MKIKAFTLAEAMVMIAVLGIITAVVLPTIVKKDFKTDTNVRAASKAYSSLTQVVSNITQDGYYYKKFDKEGFADTSEGIDVLTGKTYNGTAFNKFKDILLDSFYATNIDDDGDEVQFDTPDGIRWRLLDQGNVFNDLRSPLLVQIDTNIKNGTDFMCYSPDVCKTVDSLLLLVHRNGNVVIDGVDNNSSINYLIGDRNYNDQEFVRKILGQHEDTQTYSSYYN